MLRVDVRKKLKNAGRDKTGGSRRARFPALLIGLVLKTYFAQF